MEPRRPRISPKAARRVKENAPTSAAYSLPHIAELIDHGEIIIGALTPVGCVAVASDEDCTYAMLRRRKGETLLQLLCRLDQAIDKALTLGIFTDEIDR